MAKRKDTDGNWTSDDISFCLNDKCRIKRCQRNPKNIHYPWMLHSYMQFEGTAACLKAKGETKK